MPAPVQNFAGLSYNDLCGGTRCGAGFPPDINGDVGPNNYVEAVNDAYAIYSKTGVLQASFTENSLWSGSGSNKCNGNSFGDPVVLYDPIADRWILSNFAFSLDGNGNPVSPFYQCIAVSRSSDPVSGGWYLYPILTDTGAAGQPPVGTLNDYGKFGVWNDCLYYAANGFNMPAGGTFSGSEFADFSRSDMYAGAPLHYGLGFVSGSNDVFTMIPSNISGPAGALPSAGTPDYYVEESQSSFGFNVRKFTPASNCNGGTLGAATLVNQQSYNGVYGGDLVPQQGSAALLDDLADRLMQKVQYRKVGSSESLWVTHTVDVSGQPESPQWAQINVTGGTVSTAPVQQQIYTPGDGLTRWMSSIAADKNGDAALGFSTSSATSFPSISYAGRLASDASNQMAQGETQLFAGTGPQSVNCGGAPCHRWGDYTSMSVDPDGCTFWYTNEYYVNGDGGNWRTRIGSFAFPSCGGGVTNPTVTKLKPAALGQGATGAKVTITGTGFKSGATASVSGTGVTVVSTSFVSSTSLTAKLKVDGNAAVGARDVTVTNSDTGSGTCGGCLTIDLGPVVTSVVPSSGAHGTSNLSVKILGANFANGAKVKFNKGINVVSHTFVSPTEIDAVISIASTAKLGGHPVTVTNPDKGVGTLANAFTVT